MARIEVKLTVFLIFTTVYSDIEIANQQLDI